MSAIRAGRFTIDLYGWTVYFSTDREQWARTAARRKFGTRKECIAEAADSAGICQVDRTLKVACIGVFDRSAGTLAHEMTHAAMEVLGHAEVKITQTNHESLAYLVGYMVDRCMPALVETWK